MTRSLKVYQGEDLTPVTDLTEPSSNVHVIWDEIEAGHRAYQLESSQSSFPMRDERGETGSELNLPGGLTHVSLAAHNRIEWLEGDTVMFRGRIGPKDYRRGRQKSDRAREVTVNAEDINFDLRGIIVDGWTRPEETDVARIQALLTDYLSGSPRVTTDISDTYLATGSNTVTLPALRYDSTAPESILRDLATISNKLAFVTVDSELFYDGHDSTVYQAGIRISDRIADISGAVEDIPIIDLPAHPTIPTPNGDFELGDGTNWSGVTAGHIAAGDPSGAGGSWYAQVNTLSPLWYYAYWDTNNILFNAGTPYTVSLWMNGGNFVYFGDTAAGDWVQGAWLEGGGSVQSGRVTLTWTPSANSTSVRLVQTRNPDGPTPGESGELIIDQVLLLDTAALFTFPPIWDVGPSSTEDGMQLLSGLRLYYGPEASQFVYVNDPTTANQYAHYEESLFTSDPAISTASAATTLATAILARRKTEDRTYNVSIGPLTADQVGCLKPGQLLDIKARAIPDADDAFVSRRIAQLRWTTPVPGVFFAHMQLNRPMKEIGYGVGNKDGAEAIGQHALQGSNSHPEFVPRALLTTQGDMPYRGASDWTRLPIGASNTRLASDGVGPLWVPKDAGGSGMSNPMTTAGDIIKGGASGAAQRLGIGSAGQVLKVVSGAPAWAAESGGAGGGSTLPLDTIADYGSGDDFSGTSLDGGWSSLQTTALTTVDASIEGYLILANSSAVGNDPIRGIKRSFSPAGDFMVWSRVEYFRNTGNFMGASIFAGASDPSDGASGNRIWGMLYGSSGNMTTQFGKTAAGSKTLVWDTRINLTPFFMPDFHAGKPFPAWIGLRRVGTALSFGISLDGVELTWHATTTTIGFTVATCGLTILHQGIGDPSRVIYDYIATDDMLQGGA